MKSCSLQPRGTLPPSGSNSSGQQCCVTLDKSPPCTSLPSARSFSPWTSIKWIEKPTWRSLRKAEEEKQAEKEARPVSSGAQRAPGCQRVRRRPLPSPHTPGGGGQGPAGVAIHSLTDGWGTSTKGGVVWLLPAQTRGQATHIQMLALPVVAL